MVYEMSRVPKMVDKAATSKERRALFGEIRSGPAGKKKKKKKRGFIKISWPSRSPSPGAGAKRKKKKKTGGQKRKRKKKGFVAAKRGNASKTCVRGDTTAKNDAILLSCAVCLIREI